MLKNTRQLVELFQFRLKNHNTSQTREVIGVLLFTCFLAFVINADPSPAVGSDSVIDMGLSARNFQKGEIPEGWTLRQGFLHPATENAEAKWVKEDGVASVKLHSNDALTFLEKTVNIDIKKYPIVSWKWKVVNLLTGINERIPSGDDHPIRLFFVFAPDESEQSLWFRFKRFLYLDRVHGHPIGGKFTEYLWSSHLQAGEVIPDPGKPAQKLMVVEGGSKNLGKWLSYRRNLYDDFKKLYGQEPTRLIFIGILNDTDATGQEAVSYITDLYFHRKEPAPAGDN